LDLGRGIGFAGFVGGEECCNGRRSRRHAFIVE
jgi:hypothetical protein